MAVARGDLDNASAMEQGKAYKPRLQRFAPRTQQSVNQGCVAFEVI